METNDDMTDWRHAFLTRPIEPDPVIKAFKKDVHGTLLIENLRRGPKYRSEQFLGMQPFSNEAQARLRERRERRQDRSGQVTSDPA